MARATLADLYALGLPEASLAHVPPADQLKGLDAASGMVDTYLRSKHTLPLVAPYPHEIIRAESVLAAWDLITTRGHNPIGFDESLKERADGVMDWLKDLAAGRAHLPKGADSTPTVQEGRPRVESQGTPYTGGPVQRNATRGW
jgi:phage gp36-like protein